MILQLRPLAVSRDLAWWRTRAAQKPGVEEMFSGLHRAFNSEARLRNRSGDVHPSGARAGFPMAMA